MRSTRIALALGALAALSPAQAQERVRAAPSATPIEGAANQARDPKSTLYPNVYQGPLFTALFATSTKEVRVDESGLRYYASLHNVARAEAEIRRLKGLNPDWVVPTNIYAASGAGNDEQPFWDLFTDARMEELHAGIDLRMKNDPNWKPSRDLTTKIARKEASDRLVKASEAKQWAGALEIADAEPGILHCAYMDVDWRVAEAFANIGLKPRALEVYHAIIASCKDHDERLSTIRKAIPIFSVDEVRSLIAMGAKGSDGAGEFDAVRIDLTRARVGAVNGGQGKDDIEADAMRDFAAEVERSRERGDLSLLGWYNFGRRNWAVADKWFSLGLKDVPIAERPETAKLAEGHALSLVNLGLLDAARRFAWEWRDVSDTIKDVYVGAMATLLTRQEPPEELTQDAIDDFVALARQDRAFTSAQALAWHYVERRAWDEAAGWFRAGFEWRGVNPKDAPTAVADKELLKAIEGYAQSLAALENFDDAVAVADAWRNAGAGLRAQFISLVTQYGDRPDQPGAMAPALRQHYGEAVIAEQSALGAQNLGWLSYREKNFEAAVGWFERSLAWSAQGTDVAKTNHGYALALVELGRYAQAEEIAWNWRAKSAGLRSLYVSAVVAQLSNAELSERVTEARVERFARLVQADHSAEGARALGWYRLQPGNCGFAVAWFRDAIAWTADSQGDAKTNEGLAQALRAVGQYAEAEEIAYSWRERSPDMRELYVKVAVQELTQERQSQPMDEGRVARFTQVALAESSSLGAQAIGWRRYGEAGCGYGGDWFRLAALWSVDRLGDAKLNEGYALALRAVGRLDDARAIVLPWVAKAPQMKKLYVDVMVEALSRDNPPEPIAESNLGQFGLTIEPMRSALGAQALGWYRYERHEVADAAKWFKSAVDWWPAANRETRQQLSAPVDDYAPVLAKLALTRDAYRRTPRAYPNSSALVGKSNELYVDTQEGQAKTIEGYALTLRDLGRADEAEAIAYEWRDRWPSLRTLFVDIAIAELARADGPALSQERMDRYGEVFARDNSIRGAQAMGWHEYARQDFAASARWFKSSIDWSGDANAEPEQKTIEAYVLSLRGAGRFSEAAEVASAWSDKNPGLRTLYFETALVELQHSGKDDKISMARAAQMEDAITQAKSFEGATAIGWIAYQGKDYARALAWFKLAIVWSGEAAPAPKALEGYALTLRGLGRFDEFADFAHQWRVVSPEMLELYENGMIELLTRADPPPDVPQIHLDNFAAVADAARSPAAAQAFGWYFANRKSWGDATAWFTAALDWAKANPLSPGGEDEKYAEAVPKMLEGYVQALRNTSRLQEAEDVAWAWRERSDALRGLYVEIFVQEMNQSDVPGAVAADRMERFSTHVLNERSVVGAQNLGWMAYRGKDWSPAIDWFEKAIAWSPKRLGDAKINEGYALALKGAGRLEDAEAFAWAWRDQSPSIRAVYISAVAIQMTTEALRDGVSAARVERFSGVVKADQSVEGAQALGWFRLAQANCGFATPWFRAAIAWSPDHLGDARGNEGLIQSLRATGAYAEADALAFAWSGASPELRALYIKIGVEELTRDWPRVEVSEEQIARFATIALADRASVAAQALGWRRYGEAGCGFGAHWFDLAIQWAADGKGEAKINEGYGLTLLGSGRLSMAEAVAWPWILKTPVMKKLYIDVGVEELSRDNPPEPMAEPRVANYESTFESDRSALGAQALGWYRYERHENAEALKWFKAALDWWPPIRIDESKKLTQPVDDYAPILAKLALEHVDYRRTPRAYPNLSMLIGKASESYVDTPEGLAKTVEGYALALRAAGRALEAENLAWEWRDRWPALRALFVEIAIEELARDDAKAISPQRLVHYAELVNADRSARGALALGWRNYNAEDFGGASQWFKSALDWSVADKSAAPDPKTVAAYALALRGAKRFDDALEVVGAWKGKLPELGQLYIQVGMEGIGAQDPKALGAAARLKALAAEVSRSKSAEGAAAFGWLAYQRKDYPTAFAWFKQSIVWAPAEGPGQKALEGFALTLKGLGKIDDLLTFSFQWSERMSAFKPAFVAAIADALANSATNGVAISPEMLVRASAAFAEIKSSNGAQALAWQRVGAKDWATAAAWFKAAIAWSPEGAGDAKMFEGEIIALRNLGKIEEAEALAYSWAARDEGLRSLYVEIVADRLTRTPPYPPDEAGMRRFAALVLAQSSANGAQALGWYSLNTRQPRPAAAWFEKAMAWEPNESNALGLAYAYRQVGDRFAYGQLLNAYRDRFGKIADLAAGRAPRAEEGRAAKEIGAPAIGSWDQGGNGDKPRRRGAALAARRAENGSGLGASLRKKDYLGCITLAEEKARAGGLSASDELVRGWCLLGMSRPQEAAVAFEAAFKGSAGKTRDDAAYGKALALLQSGQSQPAAAAAGAADLSLDRRNAIGIEVLGQRAISAYESKRYAEALELLNRRKSFAPESRDLMAIRAWAMKNLGDGEGASQIFRNLDAQLSTTDTVNAISATSTRP